MAHSNESLPMAVPVDDVTGPRQRMKRSLTKPYVMDEGVAEYLSTQGYPKGLQEELVKSCKSYPSRVWILDNSGSMGKCDGKVLMDGTKSDASEKLLVQCSRWEELCDTVAFQADMVAALNAPTDFRLLNRSNETGEQYFTISSTDRAERLSQAQRTKDIMSQSVPNSSTPLTMHLHAVKARILREMQDLTSTGARIVVVIATDGLPSDQYGKTTRASKRDFREALRGLQGLPVWVVVRLMTDDEDVVDYWNDIDAEIEVPLEVLDDWLGEAAEIYAKNPWLNYPEVLHHVRELGFAHPLLDLIDERRLEVPEMLQFLRLLFGRQACRGMPDPRVDYDGFQTALGAVVEAEGPVFGLGENVLRAVAQGRAGHLMRKPVPCGLMPWIDLKRLARCYNPKSATCVIS